MKRFPLDEFKPISDQEPEVTAHLRAMLLDMAAGTPQAEDYTAEAWKKLSSKQKEIQDSMKFLGDFISLTLVQRSKEKGQRIISTAWGSRMPPSSSTSSWMAKTSWYPASPKVRN